MAWGSIMMFNILTVFLAGMAMGLLEIIALLIMPRKDFDVLYNTPNRPDDGSFVFNDKITSVDLATVDVIEAAFSFLKSGNPQKTKELIGPLMMFDQIKKVPQFRSAYIESLLLCNEDIEARKNMMEYLIDKKEDETLPLFYAKERGQKLMHECWRILDTAKSGVRETANVCGPRGGELDEETAAIKEKTDRDIEDIMGSAT
jgi:hypothetical protein